MANKVIGDYTAAITIDGSTHYLLIQPGGSSTAYNKISRNVFLGVSGQPADISSSQTFTNKFLSYPAITIADDFLILQDGSDLTKQAKFQLSGITTGTTRTYTLPNASSTLVDLSTSQTLTNKTLTSPTISGGTIDNTTITVDSILGHTSATVVTVGGVQMNNGTIGTSNAVINASIADSAVTPAKLLAGTGTGWTAGSWTPTFANFTKGNATISATYIQIGKTVIYSLNVQFGNTSAMGTAPTFTLPVTSVSIPTGASSVADIGSGSILDNGSAVYSCVAKWASTTTALIQYLDDAAGGVRNDTGITSTTPMTWTTSDGFFISGTYQAA